MAFAPWLTETLSTETPTETLPGPTHSHLALGLSSCNQSAQRFPAGNLDATCSYPAALKPSPFPLTALLLQHFGIFQYQPLVPRGIQHNLLLLLCVVGFEELFTQVDM